MLPLCLNTSTIRPKPLREKIEAAARAGYDMVELWCVDVEAFVRDGGTLAALRAQLGHAGLSVPSMIALTQWADIGDADFERYLLGAGERMETAAALGCTSIVASPPPRTDVDLAVAGARYAELLALGRRIGVRPAMEFLGFAVQIHSIRTALEVMARANDPAATIVLDPFHIFRGGGSFDDVRLVPGHAIGICHFNDAPGDRARESQGDSDRVLPGDGILPLREMVRSLRAVGYHGPVSLELFNAGLWERDAFEVAAEGLAKMRAVIAEA